MNASKHMGSIFIAAAILLMIGVFPSWAGINDGLVAYYPFNGNANDASGNGNNGTVYGGVSPTFDHSGNANSAYLFDGTNGYVSVPSSASLHPSNQFTMSFWIRVDDLSQKSWTAIIEKQGSAAECLSDTEYAVQAHKNGHFQTYSAGDGGCYRYVDTPDIIPIGQWIFYTAVIDRINHTMSVYINGSLQGSIADNYNSFTPNDHAILIGWTQNVVEGNTAYFKGALDEVRLYNRALSVSEVQQLYTGSPTPPATPVGYNPQWLIITLVSLTFVGGILLRRKTARQ